MEIQTALQELGLSKRESKVYQILLQIGKSTITRIIKETGIPSSKIYDVLERLEQKGLATHIIVKGKKEFHPASPKKLFNLINEKKEIINNILPKLEKVYKNKSEEIQAEIFKGIEGIKTIFDDIIQEGKDWVNIGASGKSQILLPYYLPHFYKKMKDKNIKLRILAVNNDTTKNQFSELKKKYNNIFINLLPKSINNFMSTFIYGNKIVIFPITLSVEVSPIAIMIKSRESADSYREMFELLWKTTKSL